MQARPQDCWLPGGWAADGCGAGGMLEGDEPGVRVGWGVWVGRGVRVGQGVARHFKPGRHCLGCQLAGELTRHRIAQQHTGGDPHHGEG